MIIPMTPKGAPLSNRSVRRTCGKKNAADCTLKEWPNYVNGRPLWGRCRLLPSSPGVLRTTRLLSGDRFAVIHRGNRTGREIFIITMIIL